MAEQERPVKHTHHDGTLRSKVHAIIFEAETPTGKIFDVLLLILILVSVLAVMLETVKEFDVKYHDLFLTIEWVVTILFTLEYGLRIYSVKKPSKYIFSFYGLVDLLAILPTYISLIFAGSQYLLTIRALRLLRIFRVFKLARYLVEGRVLIRALMASRPKIIVFLTTVFSIVIFIGSIMYLVEGEANEGFTSIPRSVYWAIVTITTVGYGDITPVTTLGQMLSAMLMVLGYAIIAVPTGIVSVEIAAASRQLKQVNTEACPSCGKDGHDVDAKHCKFCGAIL